MVKKKQTVSQRINRRVCPRPKSVFLLESGIPLTARFYTNDAAYLWALRTVRHCRTAIYAGVRAAAADYEAKYGTGFHRSHILDETRSFQFRVFRQWLIAKNLLPGS